AAGGRLILRVATDAAGAVPVITGAQLLSQRSGPGGNVALYSFTTGGLHRLDIGGTGAFTLTLGLGGDLNADGAVDGLDSDLLRLAGAGTDIDGNGAVNAQDRQVLNVNFGIRRNAAPTVAANLPVLFTHVDLAQLVTLSDVARDPDGDPVFFRIASTEHVTASFTPDGQFLRVRPDAGFAGVARITLVADDGFAATGEIALDLTVSDAELLKLSFLMRDYAFDAAGEVSPIVVIGQFADQADVVLPFDYVSVTSSNPNVVRVSDAGLVTAIADGDGYITARRGGVAAATAMSVGSATDANGAIAQIFGIDAYPDAVTILPSGGKRQIVTELGKGLLDYINKADGVVYVGGNDDIISVSDTGLIRAVGTGKTCVTIIYRGAEEVIEVTVAPPVEGNSAAIPATGGAILTPEGIEMAFGAGQLDGTPTVTVTAVEEAALEVAVPPAFTFLQAATLEIAGGNLSGPIQMGAKVDASVAAPGDQVLFFVLDDFTQISGGEYGKIWRLVDTGRVDENGVARTASPPFPGLSEKGSILVAKANQPIRDGFAWASAAGLAMAGVSVGLGIAFAATGGLAGAAVGIGLIGVGVAFYALSQTDRVKIYEKYLDGADYEKALERDIPAGNPADKITLSVVSPKGSLTPAKGADPQIQSVTPQISGSAVTLKFTGQNMFYPDNSALGGFFGSDVKDGRIKFAIGNFTRYVTGADFKNVTMDQTTGIASFSIEVPQDILLTKARITFERPDPGAANGSFNGWTEGSKGTASQPIQIKNTRGYAAVGGTTPMGGVSQMVLQVFDVAPEGASPTGPEQTELVKNIPIWGQGGVLNYWPNDVVFAADNSAAFISTKEGIAVVDMLMLRQFDVNPDDTGMSMIKVPGGEVGKLTLSGDGNFLYAAGAGKVHVIDLRPGSSTYLKGEQISLPIPAEAIANVQGKINDLELSADGKKLYVAVPFSGMFGNQSWARNRTTAPQGKIYVVNVDPSDRGKPTFHKVIKALDAGLDPYDIDASSDPNRLVFVSRGDFRSGFYTIQVTSDDPENYAATVTKVPALTDTSSDTRQPLELNARTIGVAYSPIVIGEFIIDSYRRATPQRYDLDIRYPVAVELSPDMTYAFVADYDLSRYLTMTDYLLAYEIENRHELGNKIGLIRNPFNLDQKAWADANKAHTYQYEYGTAGLVGSTSPINGQFLTELAMRPDGSQLIANFRRSGSLVTLRVEEAIKASDLQVQGGTLGRNRIVPIDLKLGYHELQGVFTDQRRDIYGTPLDILFYGRGLDIQDEALVELVRPTGVTVVNGTGTVDPLKFEAHLDPRKIGSNTFKLDLFVSTQGPGAGLFPGDAARDRAFLASSPTEAEDYNTWRLINTRQSIGSFAFESGKYYVLGANGKIESERALTAADVTGGAELRTAVVIEVSKGLSRILTGSQDYHWGVAVARAGGELRADAVFETPPVIDNLTQFSTVNVLTHGFQISPMPDYANTPLNESTLAAWLANAEVVSEGSGGGTILVYNRQTGRFHEYDPTKPVGGRIATAPAVPASLPRGTALTLVMDWYRESDISDAGFAEAAADAFFASLVWLNEKTNIFDSPMHFIGHSRGTVVNSEVIQRIGTYFPESAGKNIDIHMTTLDPHDFKQDTLKVEFKKIVDSYLKVAKVVGRVVTVANPFLGGLILKGAEAAEAVSTVFYKLASLMGLQIAEIAWDDFKDPNVQVWSNIDFADNYFQETAEESAGTVRAAVEGSIKLTQTTTPNGTAIPTEKDGKDKLPSPKGVPDVEIRFTKDAADKPLNVPGFISDDLFATPHSRITNWYMGTADVNALYLGGEAIWRTAGDEGVPVGASADPGIMEEFTALFSNKFTKQPWYGVDPITFETGSWTIIKSQLDRYFPAAGYNPLYGNETYTSTNRNEALGVGFYFSRVAGDPKILDAVTDKVRTPLDFDNTEVDRPSLGFMKDPADPTKQIPVPYAAVPSVFNGDFSQGTRHAFSNYLKWLLDDIYGKYRTSQATPEAAKAAALADAKQKLEKSGGFFGSAKKAIGSIPDLPADLGRFPLHYDLPGWSMHGGIDDGDKVDEGVSFTFDLFTGKMPENMGLDGPIDITGLFLMNQNWIGEVLDVAGRAAKPMIDRWLTKALDRVKNPAWEFSLDPDKKADMARQNVAKVKGGTIKEALDADGKKIFSLVDDDGNELMTAAKFGATADALVDFIIDDQAQLDLLIKILDGVLKWASGTDVVKEYLAEFKKDWDKARETDPKKPAFDLGAFTLSGGAGPLALIFKTPVRTDTPLNTETDREARLKHVSGVTSLSQKNLGTFLSQLFPTVDTKADFGLVMGGSQALKELVKTFTPDGGFTVLGNHFDPQKAILNMIDAVGQVDKITHNRMYIPTGVQQLKFDAFIPVNVNDDFRAEVTFQLVDGASYVAQATYIDPKTDTPATANHFIFQPGLFSSQTATFQIPPEVIGKVANVTIKNIGLERKPATTPAGVLLDFLESAQLLGLGDAVSVVMVVDDIRLVAVGSNQTAATVGTGGQVALTVAEAQALAEVAEGIWIDKALVGGASDLLDGFEIRVADLEGDKLAYSEGRIITLDRDAAGNGWFIDATPGTAEEFAPVPGAPHVWQALAGGAAAGRVDLLTVLMHEMGNVMGLSDLVDPTGPGYLMTGILDTGMRRAPSASDIGATPVVVPEAKPESFGLGVAPGAVAAAFAAAPIAAAAVVATDFQNGDFAGGLTGWTTSGNVAVTGGAVVMTEDLGAMSGLSQTFKLPAAATAIQFRLSGLTLKAIAGSAPDAFEVALFEAGTTTPILPAIASLTGTDAVLNIQADGTRHTSAAVGIADVGGALVVTLDLTGLAVRPDAVTLSFDLIGLGARDASARVDDVRLLGLAPNTAPVAAGETARTDEDTQVDINILGNDSDAEGDPLILEVLSDLGGARLLALGNGVFRYTPAPNQTGTVEIDYRLFDGVDRSNTAKLTVTIDPVNDAPTIDAIARRVVARGTPVTVTPVARDPDAAAGELRFTLEDGPSDATLDPATGRLDWTPTTVGDRTVRISVRDAVGASSERSYVIAVRSAPVLSVSDVAVTQGAPLVHAVSASDEDGGAGLLFAKTAGPNWISINPVTGAVTGNTAGQVGVFDVTVTVTDPDGLTATRTFAVDVNVAPQISAGNVTLVAGEALSITPLVVDPDSAAGNLTFALAAGAPAWLIVDAATGEVTGDSTGQVGAVSFGLTVMDEAGLSASTTVTVTVRARPVLALTNTSLTEGATLSHAISATDADSAPASLRYSKIAGPDWISVDALTGALSGNSTGHVGTVPVTIRVVDPDGLAAEGTLSVRVNAVPLVSLTDQIVVEGAALALTPAVTDADSPAADLRFEKVSGPAWISVDAATGVISGDTTGQVGLATLRLRVTDAQGLSAEAEAKITVRARPVLVLTDTSLVMGDALAHSVSATDADGPTADLRFVKVAGPDWISVDAVTGAVTGDSTGHPGAVTVTVAVTDGDRLRAEGTFRVDVNARPVLAAQTFTVIEGAALTQTIAASDADAPVSALTFRKLSGPDWVTVDTATGAISGDSTGRTGTHVLRVEVTDADKLSVQADITVLVQDQPQLTGGAVTLTEGAALAFIPGVTDADSVAGQFRFAKVSGPAWISVDPVTGALSGDSTGNSGVATLRLSVTDQNGLSAEADVIVDVNAVPRVTDSGLSLVEGGALAFTFSPTDADGPVADLTLALVSAPTWITFDPVTGQVSGDSAGRVGRHEVVVSVTDRDGLTSMGRLTVTVLAVPVLTGGAVTLTEGAALAFAPTVRDADSTSAQFTFAKVSGPTWITVDPATGALSGDSRGHPGEAVVRLSVTDQNGLSAEADVAVDINARPVLAGSSVTLIEGQTLSLPLSATDLDLGAGALRFERVAGPAWISVDPKTGLVTGDSTGRGGEQRATFRVTDPDGLTDEITLTIDVNVRPVLSVADVTLVRGDALSLDVIAPARPDPADRLVFRMVSGPEWIVVDPATGRLSGDSTGRAGAFRVTLSVTNADGLSAEQSLTVTVRAAPVLASRRLAFVEGEPLALALLGQDDDTPAAALSYRLLSAPDWVTLDPVTGTLRADTTGRTGATVVLVEVRDADGLTGIARFDIAVTAPQAALPLRQTPILAEFARPQSQPVQVPPVTLPALRLTRVTGPGALASVPGGSPSMGALAQIVPVLFLSDGGVREIILEVTHRSGTLSLIDAVQGVCLPFGITVESNVATAEGKPPVMRVTVRSEQPLPAGTLDLFRIRVLQGDQIAGAGLTVRTLSINGQPVTDAPAVTPDGPSGPVRIDLGVQLGLAEEPPALMDVVVSGFGASTPGTRLIDPAALSGGYVGFRFSGLGGAASDVRLVLDYDRGALSLGGVLGTVEGAEVTLNDRPDVGEAELRVTGLPSLLPELAVLACIAFARPAGTGRGTGKIRIKSLSLDGADIPLEDGTVGWIDQPNTTTLAQAAPQTTVPLASPLHMPDR
ncbi:MAG: hypothetical protein CFE34_01980, partial [Rhodobacteraceae bacterium PARR1]